MGQAVQRTNSEPALLARRMIYRDGKPTGACELIFGVNQLKPGDQLTCEGRKAARDARWNLSIVLSRSL